MLITIKRVIKKSARQVNYFLARRFGYVVIGTISSRNKQTYVYHASWTKKTAYEWMACYPSYLEESKVSLITPTGIVQVRLS